MNSLELFLKSATFSAKGQLLQFYNEYKKSFINFGIVTMEMLIKQNWIKCSSYKKIVRFICSKK